MLSPHQEKCRTYKSHESQTHHAIALRLGVDLKIFDFAATKSASGLQVQVDELAGKTGAEPQLISLFTSSGSLAVEAIADDRQLAS